MGEKSFETPIAGGDLWSMGFDVDLNLDARKNAFNHVGSNLNHNESLSYGDMLLHRFDVLNDGDITDLTNSLPKGDPETTAQSLIAKIGGHELTSDISNQELSKRSIDACLFSQPHSLSAAKPPLQPVDVYGRVTLFEGKLVLQLRHFNVNTNYPINVDECWLCREKMANGSSIHSHKHVLQGLFQVNDEFIQMDIDHYIIPDQALDTVAIASDGKDTNSESNNALNLREQSSSVLGMQSPCSKVTSNESICVNPSSLSFGPHKEDLSSRFHYSSSLVTSLSHNNASLTSQKNNISSNHSNNQDSSKSCNPNRSSENIDIASSLASANSPFGNENHRALANRPSDDRRHPDNFSGITSENNNIGSVPVYNPQRNENFERHTTYEPNIGHKGNFFFDHYYHTYHSYDHNFTQTPDKIVPIRLPAPSSSSESQEPVYQNLSTKKQDTVPAAKIQEVGAKKRKSRTQKKTSIIKLESDPDNEISSRSADIYPLSDWISQGLSSNQNSSTKVSESVLETKIPSTLPGNGSNSESTMRLPLSKLHDIKNENKTKSSTKKSIPKKVVKRKHAGKTRARAEKIRKIASRDLVISCQICRIEFKNNLISFKDHLLEHKLSPSFVFLCSCCSKSVSNIDKFVQHLKTHSSNRLSCKLCGTAFSKIDKLERHFDNIHCNNRPFKCDLCSKCFSRSDSLKLHRNIHFDKQYLCEICNKLYSSHYNLKVHKKQHQKVLPFPCKSCDKSFSSNRNLESHKSSVHSNKKFKCDICLKLFSRIDVMVRHQKNVHQDISEAFHCELCPKKYKRKDLLKRHMREHSSSKDFKCHKCPTVFSRNEILQKHLKIHNVKEQCDICRKFLPTNLHLKKHLRWHEAQIKVRFEREYLTSHKCSSCSKTFKNKDLLQRHVLRIHLNSDVNTPPKVVEKKFICDICSKGFTRSCNLKAHMKIHNTKSSEDEEMLDDIPTVLKRHKKVTNSLESVNSCNNYLSADIPPNNLKDASSTSNFLMPVEDSFVPSPHINSRNSPTEKSCDSSHNSPINLSTEALTATAYLLAHPFYEGPYP